MFGSYLVHHSEPNRSTRQRRSLLFSYQPAGRAHMIEALRKLDPGRRVGLHMIRAMPRGARTDPKPERVTTITDVARAADVSPATVSRALNGTGIGLAARRPTRQGRRRSPRVPPRPARPGRCAASAARCGRRSSPTSRTRSSRRSCAASRTSPASEDHRLVLCNSDEDLGTEAAYIDVVVAERMAGVVISVASALESVARAAARPRHPGRRRRPPAGARARRLGRRRQPTRWRRGDRASRRTGRPAHRVHHRSEPGRHRDRAIARLPGRARRGRRDRRSRARAAGRLQGGRRLSRRAFAARSRRRARRALRREPSDDRRRAAGPARSRPSGPATTSRSSASTTRRSPTLVSPQLTVVTQPAYADRPSRGRAARDGGRAGRAPARRVLADARRPGELPPPPPRLSLARGS